MNTYTTEELLEAKRSIASTLSKCEKALLKLQPGKSQHTLTARRIAAFRIALELLDQELTQTAIPPESAKAPDHVSKEDADTFDPALPLREKKKLPEL